jgi:hypothetical protein
MEIVCFGSLADILQCDRHVRFTPNSVFGGSGMSALCISGHQHWLLDHLVSRHQKIPWDAKSQRLGRF